MTPSDSSQVSGYDYRRGSQETYHNLCHVVVGIHFFAQYGHGDAKENDKSIPFLTLNTQLKPETDTLVQAKFSLKQEMKEKTTGSEV